MILTVGNEDYKIKFSTRLYTDGDILDKVNELSELQEKEDGLKILKPFLNCVVELVLAGLQKDKDHTDYHYDLESESEKKEKRVLVFDLLDDYVDDGGDIFELFDLLVEELQERGFLGNQKKKEGKAKKSTVATK